MTTTTVSLFEISPFRGCPDTVESAEVNSAITIVILERHQFLLCSTREVLKM